MLNIRPDIAALLLRSTLGLTLLAHGLLKIFVFTLPGAAGFFESVGFPGWAAYIVAPLEIVSGVALIIGLQSRIAALCALPVLLGALTVHARNGWVFTSPNGGWEFPAVLVLMAACVVFSGGGPYSVMQPKLDK